MLHLQKWFNHSNNKQRWVIRLAAGITAVIFIIVGFKNSYTVFLIGMIIATIWLYLEFGRR